MDFKRHYLGWDRPFMLAFADWLKEKGTGSRELDDWLIWVPSARAGRHLLHAFFDGETSGTEAFHPPRILTPAQFIRALRTSDRLAGEAQRLYAWKAVLLAAEARSLEPLFPVLPVENRETWAYGIAAQFLRLRERLAEDGWDFASIAGRRLPMEQDRWDLLSRLESAYLKVLGSGHLLDPDSELENSLEAFLPMLPQRRLIVAGILNLSQRQIACLRRLKDHGLEIEFCLPVPEGQADTLDEWGRPRKEVWPVEPLPENLVAGRLQRAAEPRELVGKVLDLADVYQSRVDALVLGAPEVEVRDYLIERSRLGNAPFYAPEGKSLAQTAWGRLIYLLSEWQGGARLETAQALLRHPLFRNWAWSQDLPLDAIAGAMVVLQKDRLVRSLDQLRDPAFPPDRQIGQVRAFLEGVDQLFAQDGSEHGFAGWLWEILQTIALVTGLPDEQQAILGQLEEVLQDLQADFPAGSVSREDYWEILRYLLDNAPYYPEREAEERPVSGWLELPWETAPHLVILGLPDTEVPGPDRHDSFITPALCRELGLYGPDESAAFHAFRLRLILENRKNWGQVDILLNDRGLDDSPVLPSRFLFLAGEASVQERVQHLLGEQAAPEDSIPATFGARLFLPQPEPLQSISVTAMGAYLSSPFRFYLERVLRWETPQPLPREMDARSFGSLAHGVMEALNRSEEGRRLVSEKDIAAFIDARLDEVVASLFGSRPGVPVRIQAESMRERLRAAARVAAGQRLAGWIPAKVEWAFHKETDFTIAGIPVRGMIDLLERNEESGAYRIVDYKTSDKATPPDSAHWYKPNSRSGDPPFPECDFWLGGKLHRWRDLQLPLYQEAVRLYTGQWATTAYFCLTKAVGDIQLTEWNPGEEVGAAALKCAGAIIGHIRSGRFPLEGMGRWEDPWLDWFGSDYLTTIDPDWLQRHAGVKA